MSSNTMDDFLGDPAVEIGVTVLLVLVTVVLVRGLSRWLPGPRVPWRHAFVAVALMAVVNLVLEFVPLPADTAPQLAFVLLLTLVVSAMLGGAYLARALRSAAPTATWAWGAGLTGVAAVLGFGLVLAGTVLFWIVGELSPARWNERTLAEFNAEAMADPAGGSVMDEARFWTLVDGAKAAAGPATDARVDALRAQLAALDAGALQAFQNRYDELLRRSYRWDLWGAAYLINGGASADGFRYFRDWLISEGRAVFEAALADPESLAALPRIELAELESFGYVALEVHQQRTGQELYRDFSTEIARPLGDEWTEDELPARFPRLTAKYAARP